MDSQLLNALSTIVTGVQSRVKNLRFHLTPLFVKGSELRVDHEFDATFVAQQKSQIWRVLRFHANSFQKFLRSVNHCNDFYDTWSLASNEATFTQVFWCVTHREKNNDGTFKVHQKKSFSMAFTIFEDWRQMTPILLRFFDGSLIGRKAKQSH